MQLPASQQGVEIGLLTSEQDFAVISPSATVLQGITLEKCMWGAGRVARLTH